MEQDLPKALHLYESACAKGLLEACNNAGIVWKGGTGEDGSSNHSRAASYFSQACDGNFKNGCFNLSVMYLQGSEAVPKNLPKALFYSMKSCDLGHPYACANAARMYKLGDGVDVDKEKAEKLHNQAKKFMKS